MGCAEQTQLATMTTLWRVDFQQITKVITFPKLYVPFSITSGSVNLQVIMRARVHPSYALSQIAHFTSWCLPTRLGGSYTPYTALQSDELIAKRKPPGVTNCKDTKENVVYIHKTTAINMFTALLGSAQAITKTKQTKEHPQEQN